MKLHLDSPPASDWTVWVDPSCPHSWATHIEPGTSNVDRAGFDRHHVRAVTRAEAGRVGMGRTLWRLSAVAGRLRGTSRSRTHA
jgi:hypothetical protein